MAFFDLLDGEFVVVSVGLSVLLVRRRRSSFWTGFTYEVTGISPQSMTVAHELNGFASSGTLYPPLNPTLREPLTPHKKIV